MFEVKPQNWFPVVETNFTTTEQKFNKNNIIVLPNNEVTSKPVFKFKQIVRVDSLVGVYL